MVKGPAGTSMNAGTEGSGLGTWAATPAINAAMTNAIALQTSVISSSPSHTQMTSHACTRGRRGRARASRADSARLRVAAIVNRSGADRRGLASMHRALTVEMSKLSASWLVLICGRLGSAIVVRKRRHWLATNCGCTMRSTTGCCQPVMYMRTKRMDLKPKLPVLRAPHARVLANGNPELVPSHCRRSRCS